jgi:hypothetical protein
MTLTLKSVVDYGHVKWTDWLKHLQWEAFISSVEP